jgi:hypothetical protein
VFVGVSRREDKLRGRREWRGSVYIGAKGFVRQQEEVRKERTVTCGCLAGERPKSGQ